MEKLGLRSHWCLTVKSRLDHSQSISLFPTQWNRKLLFAPVKPSDSWIFFNPHFPLFIGLTHLYLICENKTKTSQLPSRWELFLGGTCFLPISSGRLFLVCWFLGKHLRHESTDFIIRSGWNQLYQECFGETTLVSFLILFLSMACNQPIRTYIGVTPRLLAAAEILSGSSCLL